VQDKAVPLVFEFTHPFVQVITKGRSHSRFICWQTLGEGKVTLALANTIVVSRQTEATESQQVNPLRVELELQQTGKLSTVCSHQSKGSLQLTAALTLQQPQAGVVAFFEKQVKAPEQVTPVHGAAAGTQT